MWLSSPEVVVGDLAYELELDVAGAGDLHGGVARARVAFRVTLIRTVKMAPQPGNAALVELFSILVLRTGSGSVVRRRQERIESTQVAGPKRVEHARVLEQGAGQHVVVHVADRGLESRDVAEELLPGLLERGITVELFQAGGHGGALLVGEPVRNAGGDGAVGLDVDHRHAGRERLTRLHLFEAGRSGRGRDLHGAVGGRGDSRDAGQRNERESDRRQADGTGTEFHLVLQCGVLRPAVVVVLPRG